MGGRGGTLSVMAHAFVCVCMQMSDPGPFPSPQSLFEQQMRRIGHRRPPAAAAAIAAAAPASASAPETPTAAAAAVGVGGGAQDMLPPSSSITAGEKGEQTQEAADVNGLMAPPQGP